jgi:prepilin-type N-terminal cleavage/methylation domain-containing protein
MKNKTPIADCRLPVELAGTVAFSGSIENRKSKIVNGFTLIELLTVISIIGVLAALLFPVLKGIKRQQFIRNAQAEMAQLETGIERYKAAYGFYPPDNPNGPTYPKYNQLYYELTGTTNIAGNSPTPQYQSLANGLTLTAGDVANAFNVNGFMNCGKPGSSEDAPVAKDFLPGLKPNQYGVVSNLNYTVGATILLVSVGGPDPTYKPFGVSDVNPWRYNSSNPTNNPGAYDLWVQLSISGKTNLICNWNKQVQLNSPLP